MSCPARTLAVLALACLGFMGAAALEAPVALRPTWGVDVESLLDPSLSQPGAAVRVPTPSINFNFGIGVVMPFSPGSRLSFEPSGDFYFYNAEYSTAGQPVPTAEEDSSAFVLGLLVDSPIVYSLPLGPKFTLGLGLGLGLDLRYAFTLDPSYLPQNTPLMNAYFWSEGRFFTPSTLIRGEYQLNDRIAFGFSGRVYWPIYNLWTNEGFGFLDQTMYLIDVSILYRLGKPVAAPKP